MKHVIQVVSTALVSFFLLTGASSAQTSNSDLSTERLRALNVEIRQLGEAMAERAASYPDIIEDIRAKRVEIDRAEQDVQKMIDDLTALTNSMDVDSDFREEIKGLDGQIAQLIEDVKATNDEALADLLQGLEDRYALLQDIDRRRAEAIIEARAAIRDLENNRERLVLIRRIGAIDAAIAIMEASVSDFEDIVSKARSVADDVVVVVSTP